MIPPGSDALDRIAESPVSHCKVGIPLPDWDPQGSRHQALMMPVLRGGALVLEYQEVFANGRCQDSPGTEFEISSKISLSPEAKAPEGPHLENGPGEPIHPVVSVVRKDGKLRLVPQDPKLPMDQEMGNAPLVPPVAKEIRVPRNPKLSCENPMGPTGPNNASCPARP